MPLDLEVQGDGLLFTTAVELEPRMLLLGRLPEPERRYVLHVWATIAGSE
jgi:hypothetical protein